jgi:hypothetical protein
MKASLKDWCVPAWHLDSWTYQTWMKREERCNGGGDNFIRQVEESDLVKIQRELRVVATVPWSFRERGLS